MSKPEDDVRKDTDRLENTVLPMPTRREAPKLKVSIVPTWLGPSFELCPQRGLRKRWLHEALAS